MKKTIISLIFIVCYAAVSFSQVHMGTTFGASFYRWDKNPTTNSPELKSSSGGVPSIIGGLHLMAGNTNYRVVFEGYGNFSPFAFDINQFKGMGTFSYGGLAKFSITPWESSGEFIISTQSRSKSSYRYQENPNGGFSVGFGWEKTKTELYFTPKNHKEMTRDWYAVPYGYLAYSMFGVGSQMDVFLKFGVGSNSSRNFEIGIKTNINNIF